MKRYLAFALAAALLMAACPASANQWNLRGGLYMALDQPGVADVYDGYAAGDGSQADFGQSWSVAVLYSGLKQHHLLLLGQKEQGAWRVALTAAKAARQADNWNLPKVSAWGEGGFSLAWPDAEYRFLEAAEGGGFALYEATLGNLAFVWDERNQGYLVTSGSDTALWLLPRLSLSDFNEALFPRTMAEAMALSAAYERLSGLPFSHRRVHAIAEKVQATVPVYAAPSDKAYRAGKGKAAVGLMGPVWAEARDGDWLLVRYDISLKAGRVGYMAADAYSGLPEPLYPLDDKDAPALRLTLPRAAAVTMDPAVGQATEMTLAAGTALTVFGLYDPFYAYVGFLTADGLSSRGCVRLIDLM